MAKLCFITRKGTDTTDNTITDSKQQMPDYFTPHTWSRVPFEKH